MRHKQMRAHWSHISECSEHASHNSGTDTTEILALLKEIQDKLSCNCESRLTAIESEIQVIKTNIENITDTTGYSVTINPSGPYGLDELNGTAYKSLAEEVVSYNEDALNTFFTNNIKPIIEDNGLSTPIPVASIISALNSDNMTTETRSTETKERWTDLDMEEKRAYILQFILADPSNQLRASYLNHEMLKNMCFDCGSTTTGESVISRSINEILSDDPAMITVENQSVRLRGCPYLML